MEWVVLFALVFLTLIVFFIIVIKEFKQTYFVPRYNSRTIATNDPDYPRPRSSNSIGSN